MEPYRVYLAPGGWRVTDGVNEYGGYDSHREALDAAGAMSRGPSAYEPRTFAANADDDDGAKVSWFKG